MTKQTKPKDEPRRVGPKFARSVIPESFQIRRQQSPMAEFLDEAEKSRNQAKSESEAEISTPRNLTPVKSTPVKITPVKSTGVSVEQAGDRATLPDLDYFLDAVLPLFPPARQAILLRLYRWSDGTDREMVISTPKLAAKTNMDEKSCRTHLHGLIAEGFLVRSMIGEQIAQFGGSDRSSRGLVIRISAHALKDLSA